MEIKQEKIILEIVHTEFNKKLDDFLSKINNIYNNNTFKLKLRDLMKKGKNIDNLTKQIINHSKVFCDREDETEDINDIEELVEKYPVYPPSIDIDFDKSKVKFELFPVYNKDLDSISEYKTNKFFLRLFLAVIFPEFSFIGSFKMRYYFSIEEMNKKDFLKKLKSYFNLKLKRCESCDSVSEWFLGTICLSCQCSTKEIIDCSICKQDRDINIQYIFKTECNHKFHASCFRQYIASGNARDKDDRECFSCPNCRSKIKKESFLSVHKIICCHPVQLD